MVSAALGAEVTVEQELAATCVAGYVLAMLADVNWGGAVGAGDFLQNLVAHRGLMMQ
jgi:hypothetical protein